MRNIYLIFRRDYLSYVSAWGFWVGLLAMPVLGFLAITLLGLASNATPTRYYSVIDPTNVYAAAIDEDFAPPTEEELARSAERLAEITGMPQETTDSMLQQGNEQLSDRRFIEVPAPATNIDALRPYLLGEKTIETPEGPRPLFAAIIVNEDGNLEYWSEDVNSTRLRSAAERAVTRLTRRAALIERGLPEDFLKRIDEDAPEVLNLRIRNATEQAEAGNEVTMRDRAPTFVAIAMAYLLWLMIFSVIQYLLMGTIEERSNKIFDTLLTSIRMPHLIAGKLLAVFTVTFTMMFAWGVFGGLGTVFAATTIPGAGELISPFVEAVTSPALIIPALISFALGYVMFGVIFMALGSLCDTIQEAQTLLSPMMILLMLPMLAIVVAFNDPTSPVIDIASWIPVFTPFLLILRMPHEPPMWEVISQIGLMVLTTAVMVWIASKVYRAGAVNGAGIGDLWEMVKRGLRRKSA